MLNPHMAAMVARTAIPRSARHTHTIARWTMMPCRGRRSMGERVRAQAPAISAAVMTSEGRCQPSIMTDTPMRDVHAHPIQAAGLRNHWGATTMSASDSVTATVVWPEGREFPAPVVTPKMGRVRM